jgi:G3E family GTPase
MFCTFEKFFLFSFCSVQDDGSALGPNDLRNLSELLVGQVEFANVVILSKVDLGVDEAKLGEIEAFVKTLNPSAMVLRRGKDDVVDLKNLLFTKRFNFEDAARNPGWLKGLKNFFVLVFVFIASFQSCVVLRWFLKARSLV